MKKERRLERLSRKEKYENNILDMNIWKGNYAKENLENDIREGSSETEVWKIYSEKGNTKRKGHSKKENMNREMWKVQSEKDMVKTHI